jgi:hypothetical protein
MLQNKDARQVAGALRGLWEQEKTEPDGWLAVGEAVCSTVETLRELMGHAEAPLGSFEFQFFYREGARCTARVQATDFDSALKMMGSAGKSVVVEEK